MTNNIKIFLGKTGHESYANWIYNSEIVDNLEDADLFILTGGTDVDATMYSDDVNPCNDTPDLERDAIEKKLYQEAVRKKIPVLGICRGSQFICVMNGGKLVQHQDGQPFIHKIYTYDRKIILTTSTHHQAQFPFNLPESDYKILAWTEGLSDFHLDGLENEMNPPKEVEICFYPKTKSLAIQGHPEYAQFPAASLSWVKQLITNFLNVKL